jgi:ribosome-binding protein aMBF1 (putative translation factor)
VGNVQYNNKAFAQKFAPPEGVPSMETSVADLCAQYGINLTQLAAKSGLDVERVQAIVEGRWTPSPAERDRVAAVFGVTREQIAWGHKSTVEHIHGHGPQFGRSP